MAKKKSSAKAAPSTPPLQTGIRLSRRVQDIIALLVLALGLLILFKPMAIDRLTPQGVDVLASIGTNHQIKIWQKESGEKALWNPYVFSGMPRYQRIPPVTPSFDTILNLLGRLFNNIFIYTLFAAWGFYFMLRYFKFSPLVSFAGAALFVLMPHYKSLYLEGHNAKYRALMLLPWIVWMFQLFINKRTLWAAALFGLAFGVQVRTQHYQIIFYTGLLVFAIGIAPVVKDVLARRYSAFLKGSLLILAAVSLGIMTAAQPLFLAQEYLPWSKRGKTTIHLSDRQKTKDARNKTGVSMHYATQWSTAPSELLTWIAPRAFGGMSGEKYTGSAVPQLKGRTIPGYWGEMPFTQSYEYMGVLTLLLALLGLFLNRKNPFVIALALFGLFLTLLSFGRHFESFYSFFYNYVPYFNKFRAPMMSVTVTFFIASLLAAFGLRGLLQLDFNDKKTLKSVMWICGGFLAFGLLSWLLGQGMSFTKGGEKYDPQVMGMILSIRKEMFNGDMFRFIAYAAAGGLGVFLYTRLKLKASALAILLVALAVIDVTQVREWVQKEHINLQRLEKRYFKATDTDRFIQKDKSLFRVMPMGREFSDNRFSYFHQNVGGYTPIKMYTIEEIVENNLGNGAVANPAVLRMLNVKYVVTKRSLPAADFEPVFRDEKAQLLTYRLKNSLKRAYFVDAFRVIADEYERVAFLNNPAFKPDSMALLEEEPDFRPAAADSQSVRVKSFSPRELKLEVYTDREGLLVVSENYYPPGWKHFIDDQPVDKVWRANHTMQAIAIPAGAHTVKLLFEPDSYTRNVHYAQFSMLILLLAALSGLIPLINRRRSGAAPDNG